MHFFKNGFKWFCGILALLFFLCNCSVIWTALCEDGSYADAVSGSVNEPNEEAISASSDAAVLEDEDGADSEDVKESEDKENNADKDLLSQFHKDDWQLILVNKRHRIPEGYTFEIGTVETPKGRMTCDERIADELSKMLEDAKEDGIRLIIISPYRSIAHQKYLFNRKMRNYMKQGESYMSSYYQTAQTVTIPGSSEHQIGLAMDITSEKYDSLNEGFGESEAGIWLAENCWKYGFVVRYPAGKENITGLEYEPWHFRYVGKEAAEYMTKQGLCLEEFIELLEEAE